MRTVAVAILAFASLAAAFTDVQYQDSFSSWMQKFNKVYTSEQFAHRFAAFKVNMDFVDRWNNADNSHEVELNFLADLSNSEYQRIYLGTHITVEPFTVEDVPTVPLADTVDWRTKGAVTPIKNQGQCGSCWSFSTTGSVEGAHFLKSNNLVSLSEQNLMDCSTSEGNNGCNGGLMDNAFKYIIKNKGIDTESSYPYTAKDGTCHYNAANSGATLSSYKDVARGSESALATAVSQQPISVAIDASHNSFQLYKTGVYYEAQCSATRLDHGVLAVGYGSDGSSSYWIVKNSWGTVWGQQGYIQMSKDRNNNCGIATSASWPIV